MDLKGQQCTLNVNNINFGIKIVKNASRVVANHVQFGNKYPVTRLFPKIIPNLPTVC